MSDEDKLLKEIYTLFEKRLKFKDFKNKFNALPIDKWNYLRASVLYQNAIKCRRCNPNIATLLLCSCADALQLVGDEGKSKANFMTFYMKFCPPHLRTPPIDIYLDGKLPKTTAPFDKALNYIYKRFRCLFVHEGIGFMGITVPEGIVWNDLLDGIKGEKDFYSVDMLKISNWFDQITFESLFAML
jgi:hypothetical protein